MQQTTFAKVLQPHYNDALQYCRALCAKWTPSEAEDVLHQALLKATIHYDRLENRDKFKAWLFQIITRTFYSAIRKSFWKRFISLDHDYEGEKFPPVYHYEENHEDRMLLHDALANLPAKQRAAILLFELGGFSIEEIASIQRDKSISAVKSRLSRARQKLKLYIMQAETSQGQVNRKIKNLKNTGDLDHETYKMVAKIGKAFE